MKPNIQYKKLIKSILVAVASNRILFQSNSTSINKIHFGNELQQLLTTFVVPTLSYEAESMGQINELVSVSVPLIGTTISVIATDKQARIVWDTTMPRNPMITNTIRCGSIRSIDMLNSIRIVNNVGKTRLTFYYFRGSHFGSQYNSVSENIQNIDIYLSHDKILIARKNDYEDHIFELLFPKDTSKRVSLSWKFLKNQQI